MSTLFPPPARTRPLLEFCSTLHFIQARTEAFDMPFVYLMKEVIMKICLLELLLP